MARAVEVVAVAMILHETLSQKVLEGKARKMSLNLGLSGVL